MSTHDSQNEVILNLDGEVSPADFQRGIKSFFGVLREVTRNATNEDNVRWTISVKSGSNLIVAQAHSKGPAPQESVFHTVAAIKRGFKSLNDGTKEAPLCFSEQALRQARNLALLAEKGADRGLDKVEIRTNGESVDLSAQTVASVRAIEGKRYTSLGTVEGRLQTVSTRRGFKVVVYDSLRDRKVECRFEDESLMREVLRAFGKRVGVSGWITYKADGTPLRVRVTSFRAFRDKDDLPPPESVRGIFNRAT